MNHLNARINMIKQQLRTGDVLNESILDLYDVIPRHEFTPKQFVQFAYSDMQIPLLHNQRMLTPLEEGIILQSLNLKGTENVLEIGTGSGFLTAMLSKLCKKMISVDYFPEFTLQAREKLLAYQCTNVELITGNASGGWLDKAPFDVIVFTGAVERLTEMHRLQIVPGGKIFAIVGKSPAMRACLYQLDHDNKWHETLLFDTNIPPLLDQLKPKEFVF